MSFSYASHFSAFCTFSTLDFNGTMNISDHFTLIHQNLPIHYKQNRHRILCDQCRAFMPLCSVFLLSLSTRVHEWHYYLFIAWLTEWFILFQKVLLIHNLYYHGSLAPESLPAASASSYQQENWVIFLLLVCVRVSMYRVECISANCILAKDTVQYFLILKTAPFSSFYVRFCHWAKTTKHNE